MKKCVFGIIWVACSFFNYGYVLGGNTHRFPDQQNQAGAIAIALTGPFGVPATAIVSGFHHWLLKPYTTDQRWEAFHKRWPNLSRDNFEEDDN